MSQGGAPVRKRRSVDGTILRWLAIVIGALVGLIVIALGALWGASSWKLARQYTVPTETVTASTDPAVIARGQHIAFAITKCMGCHGIDLGGNVIADSPVLGRLAAPNLTKGQGGIGTTWSDADLARAIRHGVTPQGKALMLMPADDFAPLGPDDMTALLSYVRSVPPVDREIPPTEMRLLGRALILGGKFPIPADEIDHSKAPVAPPPAGPTREYGAYLANVGGCTGCHGPGLSGGPLAGSPPGTPNPANLTPTGLGTWTEEDFFRALRTGARPDGSRIDPFMPWAFTSQMTDDEIRATWLYLKSVPPRPSGTR
jgi:mono/diheme cytochrome c family protein